MRRAISVISSAEDKVQAGFRRTEGMGGLLAWAGRKLKL